MKIFYRNAWREQRELELSSLDVLALRWHESGEKPTRNEFTFRYPLLTMAGLLEWGKYANGKTTAAGLEIANRPTIVIHREFIDWYNSQFEWKCQCKVGQVFTATLKADTVFFFDNDIGVSYEMPLELMGKFHLLIGELE